jgi:uncharacterized protein YggE
MFQESYMRKIGAVVGVMAICALASYTYYTIKQAKYMYAGPTTVSVTGVGEVFAKPDIATFTFSVDAKEVDASATQNKAAETMNAVLAYLKEAGVDEKDVKTEYYNLTPRYEYPETICTQWGCPPRNDEPKLIGYQVSQSVSVKVRDTAKSGEIISGVGGKGATNVSSLSFTIDDEEALKTEARKLAILDAEKQAGELASNLKVEIVRMNGYWEEQSSPSYYGMGGGMEYSKDMAMSLEQATPELPTGENTITVRVNVSYEIE